MVGICHLTDSHHNHHGQKPTMVGICHGGNMLGNHYHHYYYHYYYYYHCHNKIVQMGGSGSNVLQLGLGANLQLVKVQKK